MGEGLRFTNVRVDREGVAELCRGAAMQAALERAAAPVAAACNAEAVPNICRDLHMDPADIEVEPYEAGTKVLSRTAIGYVDVRALGRLNEVRHHTLSRRNH